MQAASQDRSSQPFDALTTVNKALSSNLSDAEKTALFEQHFFQDARLDGMVQIEGREQLLSVSKALHLLPLAQHHDIAAGLQVFAIQYGIKRVCDNDGHVDEPGKRVEQFQVKVDTIFRPSIVYLPMLDTRQWCRIARLQVGDGNAYPYRFNSLPFLSTAELTQRILKAAYIIRTLTPALNILAAFCQAPIIVLCMMYVMYCHLAFREPQNPLQDIDNPPMAEVPLSEETNHGDAGVEDALMQNGSAFFVAPHSTPAPSSRRDSIAQNDLKIADPGMIGPISVTNELASPVTTPSSKQCKGASCTFAENATSNQFPVGQPESPPPPKDLKKRVNFDAALPPRRESPPRLKILKRGQSLDSVLEQNEDASSSSSGGSAGSRKSLSPPTAGVGSRKMFGSPPTAPKAMSDPANTPKNGQPRFAQLQDSIKIRRRNNDGRVNVNHAAGYDRLRSISPVVLSNPSPVQANYPSDRQMPLKWTQTHTSAFLPVSFPPLIHQTSFGHSHGHMWQPGLYQGLPQYGGQNFVPSFGPFQQYQNASTLNPNAPAFQSPCDAHGATPSLILAPQSTEESPPSPYVSSWNEPGTPNPYSMHESNTAFFGPSTMHILGGAHQNPADFRRAYSPVCPQPIPHQMRSPAAQPLPPKSSTPVNDSYFDIHKHSEKNEYWDDLFGKKALTKTDTPSKTVFSTTKQESPIKSETINGVSVHLPAIGSERGQSPTRMRHLPITENRTMISSDKNEPVSKPVWSLACASPSGVARSFEERGLLISETASPFVAPQEDDQTFVPESEIRNVMDEDLNAKGTREMQHLKDEEAVLDSSPALSQGSFEEVTPQYRTGSMIVEEGIGNPDSPGNSRPGTSRLTMPKRRRQRSAKGSVKGIPIPNSFKPGMAGWRRSQD